VEFLKFKIKSYSFQFTIFHTFITSKNGQPIIQQILELVGATQDQGCSEKETSHIKGVEEVRF
jgi:hypothetical protein